MSIPFVDLKAQYESIKNEIDSAIESVVNQTSFIGGSVVKDFEAAFAEYVGVKNCVGVANGTDAIEIALRALGVGPGDEVIVPALTWISTAGAVNSVGGEPIFVDVLEDQRTINPALIEEKITQKTKAIIPVHFYGLPAQMNEIMTLARKHNLKVLEDSAQAHGAQIDGNLVGTIGDIATFSFYPGKNLGAYGDAGAIVTNNDDAANTCRMVSNHGQLTKHDHQIIGRNSRLDTMQAAILKAKLPYLDEWTEARIRVASWYNEKLRDGVTKPTIPLNMKHVFHLYVIQSPKRDDLMSRLKQEDVGCALHYPTPLPHLKSYSYQNHQIGDFPVAEKLCSEILSLPIFPELGEEQVDRVCDIINVNA
ncbi:DegT/DnrJ/EryC1/StrS family aminotransferase [Ekhidna sp.]|uniref:DegT/DnrJ/EryC1/StrS family aminotransferase n=1 Tax=Ekhidna sp. TaxID=2608089 RepID=UPI003299A23A